MKNKQSQNENVKVNKKNKKIDKIPSRRTIRSKHKNE